MCVELDVGRVAMGRRESVGDAFDQGTSELGPLATQPPLCDRVK